MPKNVDLIHFITKTSPNTIDMILLKDIAYHRTNYIHYSCSTTKILLYQTSSANKKKQKSNTSLIETIVDGVERGIAQTDFIFVNNGAIYVAEPTPSKFILIPEIQFTMSILGTITIR